MHPRELEESATTIYRGCAAATFIVTGCAAYFAFNFTLFQSVLLGILLGIAAGASAYITTLLLAILRHLDPD